jgi:hypothetical protein
MESPKEGKYIRIVILENDASFPSITGKFTFKGLPYPRESARFWDSVHVNDSSLYQN